MQEKYCKDEKDDFDWEQVCLMKKLCLANTVCMLDLKKKKGIINGKGCLWPAMWYGL